jgi:hypothetical protein
MFKCFTLLGVGLAAFVYAAKAFTPLGGIAEERKAIADSVVIPDGYSLHQLQGFKVLLSLDVSSDHPEETLMVLNRIEENLLEITRMPISKTIMDKLKTVRIFVDWNTTNGGAQYHVSREWLLQNGYIPEKAAAVEVSNVVNFLSWQKQNQPFVILHELAHAFHHQVLGYENVSIKKTYQEAIKKGLYKNVPYHQGNEVYKTVDQAYAANNEKEYFAEITEAYFGKNDYYPFNRKELKKFDRLGYRLLKKVWKGKPPD